MPFCLTNAAPVFQHAMRMVLKCLIVRICLAYLDDVIVLDRTPEERCKSGYSPATSA